MVVWLLFVVLGVVVLGCSAGPHASTPPPTEAAVPSSEELRESRRRDNEAFRARKARERRASQCPVAYAQALRATRHVPLQDSEESTLIAFARSFEKAASRMDTIEADPTLRVRLNGYRDVLLALAHNARETASALEAEEVHRARQAREQLPRLKVRAQDALDRIAETCDSLP